MDILKKIPSINEVIVFSYSKNNKIKNKDCHDFDEALKT